MVLVNVFTRPIAEPVPAARFAGRPHGGVALLAASLIAGCATLSDGPAGPGPAPAPIPAPTTHAQNPAPPANVNLSGYPLPFRQGYADGCASARQASEQKDATRWGADMQYRQGWTDGHAICGKRSR